jgi:gamma-glutamyltranspeptidase/glutathione hydrolase
MLALGAAGSRRIISSIAQVLSAVTDLDLPVGDAVGHARIHPRLGGTVLIEKPGATPELVDWLTAHVGPVKLKRAHSYTMGAVQALHINTGHPRAAGDPLRIEAAADPRREGVAGHC